VLWLCYADSIGRREICVGAAAAVVSTLAAAMFYVQGTVKFRFRRSDVLQMLQVPWYALIGTWKILGALALQLFGRGTRSGHMRAVFFGEEASDPNAAGRRALATTYTTITPNSVSLGFVPDQGLMLYHEIVPDKEPAMLRSLGARS
jgi:multisubunit Na+/H+ antiporter MnhE subunit